jgi:hypothetical protein
MSNRVTSIAAPTVGVALAFVGCGNPAPGDDGQTTSSTVGASATASAVPSAASAEPSAQASANAIRSVADIPSAETPEPTAKEWESASRFDGRGDGPPDPDCHVGILREWFRFSCNGDGLPSLLAGVPGREYATRFGSETYIVGRLRRGDLYVARDATGGVDVFARIAWPSEAPGPTIVEVWRDPAGGFAVYPEAPQPVPLIPSTASDRPRPGDWVTGTPINMGAAESRPKNCELRILRDWLQWRCHGKGTRLESIEGFGADGAGHFKINDLSRQQGEAQLHAGMSATARIRSSFDGPIVSIRVRWPADAPQPAEIFMATEPSKQ